MVQGVFSLDDETKDKMVSFLFNSEEEHTEHLREIGYQEKGSIFLYNGCGLVFQFGHVEVYGKTKEEIRAKFLELKKSGLEFKANNKNL